MTALAEILAVDQAAALARLQAQLAEPVTDNSKRAAPVIFRPPPFPNLAGVPPRSATDWSFVNLRRKR